jgi:reverse gyrase
MIGTSQDFAMVAQKNAPLGHLQLFDLIFAREYGSTMNQLAVGYEKQLWQTMSAQSEQLQR